MTPPNKKLALVTGATGGIGASIAETLAAQGYHVGVGFCNNKNAALSLVDSICDRNQSAYPVELNYCSRASISDALATLSEHYEQEITILVNNGAIAQEKPFLTITDDDWQSMLSINLQGPFIACQEVLPGMQRQGWGRIINISSIGGQWGGYNQVHYAAAKAGLINLTQSLAKLYSAEGICSYAIAIGLVATAMTQSELHSDAGKEKMKRIPIQRLGNSEEVSKTVGFLCSEDASYLTGQTLNLNGGMHFN